MVETLGLAPRLYKCACGHEKPIFTNHRESCLDHCPKCSWKAFAYDSYLIPQHRHGRLQTYVRDLTTEEMNNWR